LLLLNPLFLSDKQIGLILCELNLSDYQVFEYLATELSCAIKLSNLIKANEEFENKLKDSVFELEQFNQILDNISQTDEMTKLYNRRGFLNLATKYLSLSKSMGKSGLLFYMDLDGLKKINDNYGHDEGDRAIRGVADILRKSFRKSNIIARLGGDEFTVLVNDIRPDTIDLINVKLKKNTDDYNKKSGKQYTLSFSTGIVTFGSNDNKTIENLLALADSALYAQKKSKTV
jgi:diguanylate cyclase (GGDEF)-like protein